MGAEMMLFVEQWRRQEQEEADRESERRRHLKAFEETGQLYVQQPAYNMPPIFLTNTQGPSIPGNTNTYCDPVSWDRVQYIHDRPPLFDDPPPLTDEEKALGCFVFSVCAGMGALLVALIWYVIGHL
jgi:hypothetical protein